MVDQVLGPLIFEGQNFFRTRIVLSCLKGRPIKIKMLRQKDDVGGVTDYEKNFLQLIESLTNGSKIDISETGSVIRFQPGIIYGGKVQHDCSPEKSIGYYLEALFMLAPFAKMPFDVTLKGITNTEEDPSVDKYKFCMLPVIQKFLGGDEENLFLKITKRGLPPKGGGVVHFKCPCVRTLKAFQWLDYGKVNKIRGVAFTSRKPPVCANQMIKAAKDVFNNYLTDIYFTVESGTCPSPGYGISIVGKSNKESYWVGEAIDRTYLHGSSEKYSPEALGREAAYRVLLKLDNGCVDTLCSPLILLFMVCSPRDVSKALLGSPSNYTLHFIKHLKDFFGVTFKIDDYKPETDSKVKTGQFIFTCVGTGYVNMNKGML